MSAGCTSKSYEGVIQFAKLTYQYSHLTQCWIGLGYVTPGLRESRCKFVSSGRKTQSSTLIHTNQGANSICKKNRLKNYLKNHLRFPILGNLQKWVVKTCHRIKLESQVVFQAVFSSGFFHLLNWHPGFKNPRFSAECPNFFFPRAFFGTARCSWWPSCRSPPTPWWTRTRRGWRPRRPSSLSPYSTTCGASSACCPGMDNN